MQLMSKKGPGLISETVHVGLFFDGILDSDKAVKFNPLGAFEGDDFPLENHSPNLTTASLRAGIIFFESGSMIEASYRSCLFKQTAWILDPKRWIYKFHKINLGLHRRQRTKDLHAHWHRGHDQAEPVATALEIDGISCKWPDSQLLDQRPWHRARILSCCKFDFQEAFL